MDPRNFSTYLQAHLKAAHADPQPKLLKELARDVFHDNLNLKEDNQQGQKINH